MPVALSDADSQAGPPPPPVPGSGGVDPHADPGIGYRWTIVARELELPELLRQIYSDTGWLLFAQALVDRELKAYLLRKSAEPAEI